MDESATLSHRLPFVAPGPKLFILDARNRIERNHLLAWLHDALGHEVADLDWIGVPLSDGRRALNLSALNARLCGGQDPMIVPVRVVWRIPNFDKERSIRKRHLLLGDPRSPGPWRARSILLRDKRRARCIAGRPASVSDLRERYDATGGAEDTANGESFAGFVARQAGLTLDIEERGLRGRRYKVPRYVADGLRSLPRFRAEMTACADELGKPEDTLYAEAEGYMRELISRPNPLFLDLKAKFDRFLLSQGYEDQVVVDPEGLARLRKTMRAKPTLLLFTHKTYIDGVTPTDIAYQNDLPMVHVFGGINLDFLGLGFFLRRSGTIFIRRSFDDNPVYKLVLRHYVSYLLEKRFPMTWAFEGTRSRLGKLMPPRYGLLKYVMDGAHANDVRDINIVPVVTSFDLIRDVEEYASEQTGRIKAPESLSWFLGYVKSLREPMGKVYVDFGEPVEIAHAPGPDDKLALSKIAFEVAVNANRATPLTLTSLMCFSLLGVAPRAMTAVELRAIIGFFVEWAEERGIRYSDDLVEKDIGRIQDTVDTLVDSGLFVRHDQGSAVVYAIEPDKHPLASYYRNSIIHHFLDKAIIELALFKARETDAADAPTVFWSETERLRDLFKFEFFYPPKDEFRVNLVAELTRADADWERKLEQGGAMLSSLINRFQPLVGHAVFLPFVESYSVVLEVLARLGPDETLDSKPCAIEALKEGRQAYLLRRITSEASIGKILFENGYKMAESQGLTGPTTPEITAARKALLRKFRALSRRMEKSRLEVLQLADKIFA